MCLSPLIRLCGRLLVVLALAAVGLGLNAVAGPPQAKAYCNPVYQDCPIYEPVLLDVGKDGNGSGTVTGGGISCGSICGQAYKVGTSVVLTATAGAGSAFTGWSDCPRVSGNTCTLSMTIDRSVTATFMRGPRLTVGLSPPSGGSVTSNDGAIACSPTCSHDYPYGTTPTVSLSASAAPGFRFTGWSGCPAPSGTACPLTLTSDTAVTANFVQRYTVTIASTPAGNSGRVTVAAPASAKPLICTTPCSVTVDSGTSVKIAATGNSNWAFGSWSGCPPTSGSICQFNVGADTTVIANFVPIYTLTVNVSGAANGAVISGPGWSCQSSCSYSYLSGQQVTLAETPGSHVPFASWGGACAGAASSCGPLTIAGNTTVSATFNPELHTLTTAVSGNGGVAGPGWTCGTSCTYQYVWGTSVKLLPAPGADSVLSSWAGCDSVDQTDNSCTVGLAGDRTVTASYVLKPYTLTVTPPVHGTITGPNGINCGSAGSTCSASFVAHSSVTLSANADSGYQLGSWTGACSGSGSCTVTMEGDRTVGASFALGNYTLTVVVSPMSGGLVASNIGGISCGFSGSACSATYPATTVVQLTALTAPGFLFAGWSSNCPGGQCVLNGDMTVTATFTPLGP